MDQLSGVSRRLAAKRLRQRVDGHTSPVTKYLSSGADCAYGRPSWNGGDTRAEPRVACWYGSGYNCRSASDSRDLFAYGPRRRRARHNRPCCWTASGIHKCGGGKTEHVRDPHQPISHSVTAPRSAPVAPPRPPDNATPPRTSAVTAVRVMFCPWVGSPDEISAV